MRMNKQHFFFLILGYLVLALTSCSPLSNIGQKNTETDLRQRVDMLWNARVNKDWNTVYELADTAFKTKTPKAEFVSSGELQPVLSYQIIDIEKVNDTHTDVTVKFKLEKMGFILNPQMRESWIFEKGNGWQLNRTQMYSKKPF